jgi:hypothetical protein
VRDQIVPWRYTDDQGNVYSVGISRYVAEQLDDSGQPRIGGGPVTEDTIGPLPVGLKPRYVVMHNPKTYGWRRVTVFSKTAYLGWSAPLSTKTLQLRERDGTLATYQGDRMVWEAYGSIASSLFSEMGGGRSVGWRYTTDLGYSYVCRFPTDLVTQCDSDGRPLVGGQPANGFPGFPNGLKPRTVTVYSAEGKVKTRRLVVCSVDAPLWTGSATPVELPSGEEGLVKYYVKKRKDEVWTGRARKLTTGEATPKPAAGEDFDSAIGDAFGEA